MIIDFVEKRNEKLAENTIIEYFRRQGKSVRIDDINTGEYIRAKISVYRICHSQIRMLEEKIVDLSKTDPSTILNIVPL